MTKVKRNKFPSEAELLGDKKVDFRLYTPKIVKELKIYYKNRDFKLNRFLKNKYMNFDIVNYKISNSEILIMESTLLNILDKWRNDELMTTINYIKYKNI